MFNKRSLTIVEVLIVIALLAGITAIVVPMIANSLNERAFETSADVTSEQLVLARAHAQATGEPVEVRYHAATAQVEARLFSPWLPSFVFPNVTKASSSTKTGAAGNGSDAADPACMDNDQADAGRSAIAEPWANRSLSHGVRIVNRRPADSNHAGSDASSSSANGVMAQLGLPDGNDDIRLAVFMPDGSALMGAPVWFNDDDGRIGKLTINPWTGLPMFERVGDADDNSPSDHATRSDANDDSKPASTASSTSNRKTPPVKSAAPPKPTSESTRSDQ